MPASTRAGISNRKFAIDLRHSLRHAAIREQFLLALQRLGLAFPFGHILQDRERAHNGIPGGQWSHPDGLFAEILAGVSAT